MAFILRVFDQSGITPSSEMYIESGTISKELDSSDTYSISIPVNTAAAADIAEGMIVELYLDGDFLLKAEIQKLNKGVLEVTKSLKTAGRGILDNLYDTVSDPTLIVESTPLLLALYEILEASSWRLGDISTIPDKDFVVELVDLRNEHSYLGQVKKLMKLEPELSLIVGDQVLGKDTINIGVFDENSGVLFRSPAGRYYDILPSNFNIISKLVEKKSNEEEVFYLESIGGEVKDSNGLHRSITLFDAWDNDNDLATDPDFPIVEIVPGQRYAVINAAENPYPGGLFYTVNAASVGNTNFMGDSGLSGRMRWTGFSFRGIPGKLNYLSIILSTIFGDFYNDWEGEGITIWLSNLGTSGSYTYDHFNAERLFEAPFVHADGLPPFGEYRIDLTDADLTIDLNTIYGLAIGFDNAQAVSSYINHIRYVGVSGTDVGMGHCQTSRTDNTNEVWIDADWFSSLKIFTNPIESVARRFQAFEKWTEYAPPKDGENNSTLAQTRAAGKALYDRSIANLMERETTRRKYTMSAIGRNLIVPLGNKVSVLGKAQTAVQNPVTGKVSADYYEVDGDFRVLGYKLNIKSNTISATYDLADISLTRDSGVVDIYDETKGEQQVEGVVYKFFGTSEMVKETVPLSSMLPDTTLTDGRDALLVEFPYDRPTDRHVSDFIGLPFVETPTEKVRIEIVSGQDDDNEIGLICKIATGAGWTVDSNVSLECYFIWR